MVTFKINGQTVQGEEGQFILQVAEKYGIEIPTMCHHKALDPAGMCRVCTVALFDGRRTRFVTACNYPIWEGMAVTTDSEEVIKGRKLIIELLLARCPEVPALQQLAKAYGIDEPRFKTENDTCILCGLCTRMCEKMGNNAITLTGRGLSLEVDTPFHLQTDACIACGACASVCPTGHISLEKIKTHVTAKAKVETIRSEYDMGLKGRKPVYVPYAQAVPNTPAIDRDVCVHFKTGGCQVCTEFCGVNAIDHKMEDEIVELDVGAIILAPGFEPFDPTKFDSYAYANHPNVITSMEMERLLSASGPTSGHLVRLSDHKAPKKIAWFQCVGSRDQNRCDNSYCSSVCCMYAIKEAVIAKEHAGDDLECAIFYMDMRTHGKEFERFYNNAQDKGVRFVRSRVHTIDPVRGSDELSVRYVNDDGSLAEEQFDMIVLSIGLETPPETVELANKLGIALTEGNFCKTSSFEPVATSKPGIYVCGAFQGPKDIPQSVVDASAAAAAAGEILAAGRNTATKQAEVVPETNVIGERPRIGVFVCRCGINIAGVVDVPSVAQYAATLPYVEYATDSLYSCAQDTQDQMAQIIQQKKLNRVVVAACTPKTHEPLFQETLTAAGLNKYLFEMANIRNHDSWVHKNNPDLATRKAKDLVRMAVNKVRLMQPLQEAELDINPTALVIGGGIAGMTAARTLARQGYETHIVERSDRLGGQAHNIYKTVSGDLVADKLAELIDDVDHNEQIHIHLNTQLSAVDGFVGNFTSTLSTDGDTQAVAHGIAVLATGGTPLQPEEYNYGQDPRIMTSLEMDQRLKAANDPALSEAQAAVFIQCVGSREPQRPYCSRVCCTHSIDNALELKKRNPDMNIFILYRDIRTYGEREYLYKEAREKGVIFVRYDLEHKPQVALADGKIQVTVTDHVLGMPMTIEADLLSLATAVLPNKDETLAQFFKVPLNEDGFFVEKHAKLGPSEFATDGVFLCGLAHYPKPIDEAIVQGRAAASRAVTLLARGKIHTSGNVAQVDPMMCASCGVCVSVCPYSAPSFIEADARMHAGKAQINAVLCKGCGLCVASCRSGAIHLKGFDNDQIFAQISAANWE
ncbi:MAG: FAD-dependent oxidoreductase [Desulfatitalea sp.]|nr:FAD-dependent oxidoreductase [Desulfatitalea sp.]NNJ99609.1 FAD-dependent oxidoreductase [Desulfatitalea sp.]